MSVVTHKSDQTSSKSVESQRASLKERVARAKAGTKDTTKSAGAAGVGAWWKSIVGGGEARKGRTAERIAHIADQTKSQTSTAIASSKVGLERAAKIGRETILPETRAHRREAQGTHAPRAPQERLSRLSLSLA